MECFMNFATNPGGIPYISTTNVTVSDTSVDLALGWSQRALPTGYFTLRIADPVTDDATGTLPVTLTRNGITRNLTLPNGVQVTANDLVDVQVITVFNDRFRNLLTLMSRTTE